MIQLGGVYTTFCQEAGILLQKCHDRNGRSITILFRNIEVRGRFDSPDIILSPKKGQGNSKRKRQGREGRTLGHQLYASYTRQAQTIVARQAQT